MNDPEVPWVKITMGCHLPKNYDRFQVFLIGGLMSLESLFVEGVWWTFIGGRVVDFGHSTLPMKVICHLLFAIVGFIFIW